MLFPGWLGIVVSIVVFFAMWFLASSATDGKKTFRFEQSAGEFEKMLAVYLDITKFILTLAAGGIVLIISSTALGSGKQLPPQYASPLFILAMSIFYGILFMPFLALNYETYKHDPDSYSRPAYIRNQALGFAALACFCLGYAWLIVAAVRG